MEHFQPQPVLELANKRKPGNQFPGFYLFYRIYRINRFN